MTHPQARIFKIHEFLAHQNDLHLDAGPHGVLMLHGLGANSIELAGLARDLHENGFTVYAPHIEGYTFGTATTNWQAWLREAQEHYWQLKAQCETVSVVGLSMGATLALMLASVERPTSIVLLSACLAYNGWSIPFYSFLLRIAPYVPFLQKYRFAEAEPYGIKNEEMRARVKRALEKDHIAESGADALSYKQISEGLKLADDIWDHLENIHAPALFIHAADDETAHPKSIEQALPLIGSKIKRLHLLGDSYHMVTVDNERETVNHETSLFLQQQINACLETPAFNMSPVVVPELRRLLRQG
jgi:carboxylesterase